MWIEEVLLGDLVPSAVPVHGLVGHRVQLLAETAGDLGLPTGGPGPVRIAHGEVDHAAVAPEPPRMDIPMEGETHECSQVSAGDLSGPPAGIQ